ncbi:MULTISPECIES: PQQ-dependent sugar dehydrogenase [Paenibacillus]|uniref:PQQ-dependent sugar dehydrogenase n=1 Tax=Paenibacillus TaxID=44249 RepID=UPI0022B8780A|nr:PQQ-dependent sugar dehydrogenase [Paenibacillus caseinilyticus]MCZ8522887.1 PQQ-dependent sugar dehydrogenase [Paenibacillus caseinilyticus]
MTLPLRWTSAVLAAALALGGCEAKEGTSPAAGMQEPGAGTSKGADEAMPYTQEVVASGLQVPWEIGFAPDGRIFFTERGGSLRVIREGRVAAEPVFTFDAALYKEGEAGVLGFALDPEFAGNGYIYVYHTYTRDGKPVNQVVRLKESGGRAVLDKVVLDGLPAARTHDGGRVKFGPDGMLYVTNGDAGTPLNAQDLKVLAGKILRITPDGGIPADNPFPGSPVYSLGHRNPQGLAWHPVTGRLYSTEHGQTAHDELNLIEPGANYGWPLLQGDETAVKPGDEGQLGPGPLKKPLAHSAEETWAPSGIAFVTKGPWKNTLLAANLRGTQVLRFTLSEDGQSVHSIDTLLKGERGRLRAVAEGPDGSLYVLTNNRDGRGQPQPDDDKIIRLKPAAAAK